MANLEFHREFLNLCSYSSTRNADIFGVVFTLCCSIPRWFLYRSSKYSRIHRKHWWSEKSKCFPFVALFRRSLGARSTHPWSWKSAMTSRAFFRRKLGRRYAVITLKNSQKCCLKISNLDSERRVGKCLAVDHRRACDFRRDPGRHFGQWVFSYWNNVTAASFRCSSRTMNLTDDDSGWRRVMAPNLCSGDRSSMLQAHTAVSTAVPHLSEVCVFDKSGTSGAEHPSWVKAVSRSNLHGDFVT